MDWSKAKTILIIALIITNSLLGYVLFISGRTTDATLKEEFIQESIRLLNNKDIKLSTEIPKITPVLNDLYVEYEMPDSYILNKLFFEGNGTTVLKGEALIEISNNDEIISIINKKLLRYESKSNILKYDINNEEDAIKFSLGFLEDKGFNTSDMKLSFIKVANGVYSLEFTKVFEENYLESAYTIIKISDNGVLELERKWLNTIEKGTTPIQITSAPKSILALISMEEAYGRTIQDISLCYYFDPEKHEYLEDPLEAKKGSAKPAWRIQFEDGHKVFVDNY